MIKGKAGEELVEEVKEQIIRSAAASEDESEGGNGSKRRYGFTSCTELR